MDKEQIARKNAADRGWRYLIKNDDELMSNQLYPPLKETYNSILEKIKNCSLKQVEQVSPITQFKAKLRANLINSLVRITDIAVVQSTQIGRTDLKVSFDRSVSFYTHLSKNKLILVAKNMKSIMEKNSGVLTKITPDDFLEMNRVINDYENIAEVPKIKIKEKKALGTDPLPGLLNEMDVVKHLIRKFLKSAFPHLFGSWVELTKVGSHAGRRRTSLVVRITEGSSGVALRNIKVTLYNEGKTIKKLSTKKGFARFRSVTSGSYRLTCEHKYYIKDVKNNISISSDGTVNIDVKLQRAVPVCMLMIKTFFEHSLEVAAGVKLQIRSLNYTGLTNEKGVIEVKDIPNGSYQGELILEGYRKIDFVFTMISGKKVALQFFLHQLVN